MPQLLKPGYAYSTLLFPLGIGGKRKRRGICSRQNLTHAKIKARVPRHQNFSKTFARNNLQARETFRTFLRPFPSPEKIDCAEGVSSWCQFFWLKQHNLYNWLHQLPPICGVRYATRPFHISNMIHDPYFTVSSYGKQKILLSQLRAQSRLLERITKCKSCG